MTDHPKRIQESLQDKEEDTFLAHTITKFYT